MEIKNFKLKINCRGEIATILTVVTLGLMLVGTVVGTKLAERNTEQRTEARGFGELQTYGTLDNCKWNTAGELCKDSGDKGRCICEKLGTGICTPVGGSCEKNPWDSSWGCWSTDKLDKCNNPGAPPTQPPAGGGQPQPTAAGGGQATSCTLAAQEPNYGNCCGSCLASKRPDLRPFFNNNGWSACNDTSIVNNWCNGVSQQASDDCKKIREGDCKDACSKDQSTCQSTGGTPGGTAGSPAPTSPPGGSPGSPGGSNGGDSGGTPSTDTTAYQNGYYVMKGKISNLGIDITSSIVVPIIKIKSIKYSSGNPVTWKTIAGVTKSQVKASRNNDPISGSEIYSFGFQDNNYIILPISISIAPAADTKAEIEFLNHFSEGDTDVENQIISYSTNTLSLCYPFGKYKGRVEPTSGATITPTPIPAITDVDTQIIQKCRNAISDISFDENSGSALPTPSLPPTPLPTIDIADPNNLTRPNIKVVFLTNAQSQNSPHQLEIETIQLTESASSYNSNFKSQSSDGRIISDGKENVFKDIIGTYRIYTNDRSINISVVGKIINIPDNTDTLKRCFYGPGTGESPIIIEKGASFPTESRGWNKDDLGTITFQLDYTDPNNPSTSNIDGRCYVNIDQNQTTIPKRLETKSLFGSSNEAFRKAMERWVSGEIGVLEMSGFVNQLTRYPGLQISFCDPRKGECNPAF